MAMNRQTKRMLQRQGQVTPDGTPAVDRKAQAAAARSRATTQKRQRTSPTTFVKEVRGELRRVAWPSRAEVINYSGIVLVTLIILVGLVFVLDYAFAKAVLFLFDTPNP